MIGVPEMPWLCRLTPNCDMGNGSVTSPDGGGRPNEKNRKTMILIIDVSKTSCHRRCSRVGSSKPPIFVLRSAVCQDWRETTHCTHTRINPMSRTTRTPDRHSRIVRAGDAVQSTLFTQRKEHSEIQESSTFTYNTVLCRDLQAPLLLWPSAKIECLPTGRSRHCCNHG